MKLLVKLLPLIGAISAAGALATIEREVESPLLVEPGPSPPMAAPPQQNTLHGTMRRPLAEHWFLRTSPQMPPGLDHETAKIYVEGNKSQGEAQLVHVKWLGFGVQDPVSNDVPLFDDEGAYGSRFDVMHIDADTDSRTLLVGGVDFNSGVTVVESWQFAYPRFSASAGLYLAGGPSQIDVVYAGNVPGKSGIRSLENLSSTQGAGRVAVQFQDSGDIHSFERDGTAPLLLFGEVGSGAAFEYDPVSYTHLTLPTTPYV